jgi:hypothetical protein
MYQQESQTCVRKLWPFLSNSKKKSPLEAGSRLASQELHRILHKPTGHHCVYKSSPPICILSHIFQMRPATLFPSGTF